METESHAAYPLFDQFLTQFKDKLHQLFHVRGNIDDLSTRRGLPPFMLREIMADTPLATYIPEQYGGRGGCIHEGLALASAASYESLPLSLGFGINWALFLQPVAKYASEAAKVSVFDDFLKAGKMGGLMITEPDHGSDALHMKSYYREKDQHAHIQGTKHWAGLTGWADYWLLTARKKTDDGKLLRDIDFFICDVSTPNQHVVVEELYENLGIYMLPYGRNKLDVLIPTDRKLIPRSTGIKMMLDLLHRSRMQFPGMGMGFLQRMLDEAVTHTRERSVGGKSLFSYDQVQQRIARLQAAYTISSAMCLNSSRKADINNDLSGRGLEANVTKTYITDLMQASAQSLLQLIGAKGYRLNHIAGRAVVDSRPFQIFEGSNDILYIQIAEAVQKQMSREKRPNLFDFLSTHELTAKAAPILKSELNFNLVMQASQRKLTQLGQIISRVAAIELVLDLSQKGFCQQLIDNAVDTVSREVSTLIRGYTMENTTTYVDGYVNGKSWLDCFQQG